jgi:hypothetical protein
MQRQNSSAVRALAASILCPPLGVAVWMRDGASSARQAGVGAVWMRDGAWSARQAGVVGLLWAAQLTLPWRTLPPDLLELLPASALVFLLHANLVGTLWLAGLVLRAPYRTTGDYVHRAGYALGLFSLSLLFTVIGARTGGGGPASVGGSLLAAGWGATFLRAAERVPPPAWSGLRAGAGYLFAFIGWLLALGCVAALALSWALTRAPG